MIKVEHTKTLVIAGESPKLVTNAKLVLVECKPEDSIILRCDDSGDKDLHLTTSIKENIFDWTNLKPISISETEKIEEGDWVLEYLMGHPYEIIQVAKEDLDRCKINFANRSCFKILALPEHFSPQQLQMIVDGKLKDGDKVLAQCFNQRFEFTDAPEHNRSYPTIYLNPHITIYPVEEKMYTREEVYDIYLNALANYKILADTNKANQWDTDKWFEQNVK